MRRHGAKGIGINQQPVQHFTACNDRTTAGCPAQPSPIQSNPFGPLVCLLNPNCCYVLQNCMWLRLNPTHW